MSALLEFMYKGEVHVSQDALSSFLKAAESLQVKGLSIEHEKLAVAQSQQQNQQQGGQQGPPIQHSPGQQQHQHCQPLETGGMESPPHKRSKVNHLILFHFESEMDERSMQKKGDNYKFTEIVNIGI